MIPPILLSIRIGWFWIPIPVVLLWPLLAIVWIILGLALMGVMLGAMIEGGGKGTDIGSIWITTWQLICGLRGTSVDIQDAYTRVKISIT